LFVVFCGALPFAAKSLSGDAQRGGGEIMRVIESLRFTSFHTIHHLINTRVKGRPIKMPYINPLYDIFIKLFPLFPSPFLNISLSSIDWAVSRESVLTLGETS
jgi:hypothetical protein